MGLLVLLLPSLSRIDRSYTLRGVGGGKNRLPALHKPPTNGPDGYKFVFSLVRGTVTPWFDNWLSVYPNRTTQPGSTALCGCASCLIECRSNPEAGLHAVLAGFCSVAHENPATPRTMLPARPPSHHPSHQLTALLRPLLYIIVTPPHQIHSSSLLPGEAPIGLLRWL